MSIGDFPDYDSPAVWQGMALYSQISGNVPVAGSVLYSGPVNNWPSLLIHGFATQGGFHIQIEWFLDAALTLAIGSDDFDAPTLQGFHALYEVGGPYVRIFMSHATTSPVAQGKIYFIPSRAPAMGFRPLVTPQSIILNSVSIPALSSIDKYFTWIVLGQIQWNVGAVTPASSVTALLETLNWDGSQNDALFPTSDIVAGAAVQYFLPAFPLHLRLTNTTSSPAIVSTSILGQQQGW